MKKKKKQWNPNELDYEELEDEDLDDLYLLDDDDDFELDYESAMEP